MPETGFLSRLETGFLAEQIPTDWHPFGLFVPA